jgi:8-hydroxy-5-deazaflavin:NADPH oxidoreductase
MTSIAVIGAGKIGGGLAKKWAAGGHSVIFGSRSPAKPSLVELAEQIGAERAEIEGAVAQSEVVVFANSADAAAEAAPRAAYYRAFNSYGWEQIERPVLDGIPADGFFCGPDGAPRATIEQLIADVGFRHMWVGGPEDVEVVDGLLRLWFTMVMKHGHSRRLAFKVLEEQA